jgi:hypothetical protein
MTFEIDVLILFADNDNSPENSEWVAQFRKFLGIMLNQIHGDKLHLMMKGENDHLLAPRMDNVGILIPVLSENFIRSGQCLDSLELFCKATEQQTTSYNRIFKVFKTPLPFEQQPPRIRELLGYEMYLVDNDTGSVREYSDYFSTEAERQYWMKLVDLAYDVYETLQTLKAEGKQEVRKIRRKTIYLAETGHDVSIQRNIIRRELQRMGFMVLPSRALPYSYQEFERIVRQNLEDADMSIHLIGSAYGEIPEGSDRSVVDLQNLFAAEKSLRAGKENFPRLIWISPPSVNMSERQRTFIETLKRDTLLQEGAEILQNPIEDFKNIIKEELLEKPRLSTTDTSDQKIIYLLHDRIDQSEVQPLIETLVKNGYKVLTPTFQGDLMQIRQHHINNLRNFDAAIIYKGSVNEQWVRMKVLDLLKAPGLGRNKPILGKAVLTRPGSKINSELCNKHNIKVMEADAQQTEQALLSLLNDITET